LGIAVLVKQGDVRNLRGLGRDSQERQCGDVGLALPTIAPRQESQLHRKPSEFEQQQQDEKQQDGKNQNHHEVVKRPLLFFVCAISTPR
jgi:hypothetical protein